MKARIVRYGKGTQLLLSSGQIKNVNLDEIKAFFKTFSSPEHYVGSGWSLDIAMEEYNGETIAYVNDEMELVIRDCRLLNAIIPAEATEYVSSSRYAEIHGKQRPIVSRMCAAGRIEGAILKGNTWLIPVNAPYPEDSRKTKSKNTL